MHGQCSVGHGMRERMAAGICSRTWGKDRRVPCKIAFPDIPGPFAKPSDNTQQPELKPIWRTPGISEQSELFGKNYVVIHGYTIKSYTLKYSDYVIAIYSKL